MKMAFSADGLPEAWNYMGRENIIPKVINKLLLTTTTENLQEKIQYELDVLKVIS